MATGMDASDVEFMLLDVGVGVVYGSVPGASPWVVNSDYNSRHLVPLGFALESF